jgi:hypothetical protein
MNNLVHKILSLFSSKSILHETKETDEDVLITLDIELISFPLLQDLLETISTRDSFHLTLKNEGGRSITFVQNGEKTYEAFCAEAQDIKGPFKFEFGISKIKTDSIISIYSLEAFSHYLSEEQSLEGILYIFNNLFQSGNHILLELQYDDDIVHTKTIKFYSKGSILETNDIESIRRVRNDQVKNLCHSNIQYQFIPDDFHLIESKTKIQNLIVLLNRLEQLYSLIYLADSTQIDEKIGYKLNGYKLISNDISFKEMDYSSSDNFFKIYDWVYNDGNLIDKIGLARNIISLDLDKETTFVPESTFHSIQSNFKIYQKENIKQYIEIRNKISDQLFEFKNKADKIIETYANDFKKSLFAFISFFASVIVIRVVSNKDFTGAFSRETTLLSFVFLLVTFMIFLASKWELTKQKERYVEAYYNLKERHKDLLNFDDIQRILNNDKEFDDNLKFINQKKCIYSWIWVSTIIILVITTVILNWYNQ